MSGVTPDGPARSARHEVRALATEAVRDDLREIDLASMDDLVRLMNREDRTVAEAVGAASPAITAAIEAVAARLARGGRLIYVGAGTSGRMGLLDAVECRPTFNTEPDRVIAILAGGPEAFAEAREGAEDDLDAGYASVAEHGVQAIDAVVGIAASGRTPFVIGAMRAARTQGALTVGLSCNVPAALSAEVEHPIEIETGPELVSGSTRLKAGTAQKLVVNMISTLAMIRIGKTFGNLMVDVRATNDKLRERAVHIVEQAAGVDAQTARDALERAGYDTKVAILELLAGIDADEAARRLAAHDGHLRRTLAAGGDACA